MLANSHQVSQPLPEWLDSREGPWRKENALVKGGVAEDLSLITARQRSSHRVPVMGRGSHTAPRNVPAPSCLAAQPSSLRPDLREVVCTVQEQQTLTLRSVP